MALWKDIVKCICLSAVFFLICIFVLWPKSTDPESDKKDTSETSDFSLLPADHNPTAVPASPTKHPIITIVTTTEELHSALADLVPGTKLQLAEGVYTGKFKLVQDEIVIQGAGERTIIHLNDTGIATHNAVALHIYGSNCEVHDLRLISDEKVDTDRIYIIGYGNVITNVQIEGFDFALISFSGSKISNAQVKNVTVGFQFIGTYSHISGDNNQVYAFNCVKCAEGAIITGNDNIVQHMEIRDSIRSNPFWKIEITKGNNNLVDHFKCDEDCLLLHSESTNSTIKNGIIDKAQVSGVGQNLVSLDVGGALEVQGSGHRSRGPRQISL